jgi:hypothetical protein
MTVSTSREFQLSATSENAPIPTDDAMAMVWEILGYELVESEWADEGLVLTTPEVQEALQQAIRDFEEWKNSL